MTRPIDAVVFDLDNTLVRSNVDFAKMRRRIIQCLKSKHPDIKVEDARTTIEIVDRIRYELPEEESARLMQQINDLMDLTEMEAVGGSRPLVDLPVLFGRLKEMNLQLGLLTRSCRDYTRAVLGDCLGHIDAISCREAGVPAKPDPQALISLARRLGTDPSRTVLVGDHITDGICAKLAGALFIGILTGSSAGTDLLELPHVAMLEDAADLPEVLERLLKHEPT